MLVLRLATAGWLTTSQDQGDAAARTLAGLVDSHGAVNRIWPSPSDPYSTRGLGGGLTFAYDPSVCDELLPAFTESHKLWGVSFIDCDSIKQAIRSAFASWSANHPSLKFHDVTADCQATADWTGGPMGIGCSRAEIYLSTTTNATSIDAAATTLNEFAWDDNFHHPNGVRAVPGLYATRGSIIRFSRSNGVCWYLDSSFCEGFHRMKREMGADTVLLFGAPQSHSHLDRASAPDLTPKPDRTGAEGTSPRTPLAQSVCSCVHALVLTPSRTSACHPAHTCIQQAFSPSLDSLSATRRPHRLSLTNSDRVLRERTAGRLIIFVVWGLGLAWACWWALAGPRTLRTPSLSQSLNASVTIHLDHTPPCS